MRLRPPRPEFTRLALVIAGVMGLIAASVAVALHTEQQYEVQAIDAATAQARVLAETAAAALAFGDYVELQNNVNALRVNDEVDAVGVYGDDGLLAAGFTRTFLSTHLDQSIKPSVENDRVIVTAPVLQKGFRLGTVYLRDRTEPADRRLSRYTGAGLLVAMALLMFLIMALDSRAIRRANRELVTQMAERQKAEEALRQSQKMEAVGRLTGGVAHDFNNMLAVVIGSLDLLVRRRLVSEPDGLRLTENALEGARRGSALTQRLLAFSRLQPLKPTSVDISKSVNDIADLLRRTLGETIVVEVKFAEGLWRAHIDAAQLESAIVNLAINARDAMPGGGKLTIEASNVYLDQAYVAHLADVASGQYVMLEIADTGTGIAPEILDQVFEPFFTTKPQGQGTGLGLSQAHGFIKQSGGHIRIDSKVSEGARITLFVPRSTTAVIPPKAKKAKPRPARRRNLSVLLVEDEAGVREFAEQALIELGYDVLTAAGPGEALRVLDAHHEVSILLTDVVMPEMNGPALAAEAIKLVPSLKVVFMTGYTRDAITGDGMLNADTHLVSKPFTLAQLAAELELALPR
ncbi:MAG TPA: ATP-binding protein [Caulobacteraceae bacterium]